MTYNLKIRPALLRSLKRLAKRNPKRVDIVLKKVEEVLEDPDHYKNLRAPLNDWKRVHIDGSYVLLFSVDVNEGTVTLEDLDHHDNIYKKRPKGGPAVEMA